MTAPTSPPDNRPEFRTATAAGPRPCPLPQAGEGKAPPHCPRLRPRPHGQGLTLAALLMTAVLPRLAAAQALSAPGAPATDWPTKPVRIITPFPAGAGPEAVARVVAEKLHEEVGQAGDRGEQARRQRLHRDRRLQARRHRRP